MENNTSIEAPVSPGHTKSLFLDKLPYDIRLMIYREVFSGSKQEVVSRSEREDPNNRYSVFSRLCLPLNRQFNLVRACKETYKEARHIYWTGTAIKLAHRSLLANLTAIPLYARQRVRALEGVPLADELSPTNQIPVNQFLAHFPRLTYCQFQRSTVYMDCHSDKISPEAFVEKSGSDAFLSIALSLNVNNPPVFVQRIYLRPTKDHGRVVWVYANHTHGRFFPTMIGSVSDEEGFEMVTGPVEEIQVTEEPADVDEEDEEDEDEELIFASDGSNEDE